ncbi:MAG: PIG-L family deacetylase [Acidobacteria bacterium]|nr:PIG-L family deacetylase [Acidobacteriota bacterium]
MKKSHQPSTTNLLATCYLLLATFIFAFLLMPSEASTATNLPEDRGIAGLLQSLERLPVVASALHTTAHPDDEDNGLLVYLSRGVHARTVLLTATRGEGGQSVIGPEKSEAMGLVRMGELLASDQYYGVEQRFTRAYEFGYSKTAEETLAKWDHEEILADFVRVIRQERPDVIISRFDGSPEGHGHHQAAGILTREAFGAAADPNRFPDQIAAGLRPWQAKKLYFGGRRSFFNPQADNSGNVKIDLGALDPILGRSYHEIGMEGLSKQRSQGVAAIIPRKGSLETGLLILDSAMPVSAQETSLFDGIDTTITGIAARVGNEAAKLPELTPALSEIQQHITAALSAFTPHHPEATAPPVLAGLSRLRQLISAVGASQLSDDAKYELLHILHWKEGDFVDAARRALSIELDVRADDATVIPGQTFNITVGIYNRGRETVEPTAASLSLPAGWQVVQTKGSLKPLAGKESVQITFSVKVADDAAYTQPYWYLKSETDNRYELRSDKYHTLPFAPPQAVAKLTCQAFGTSFELSEPARSPDVDPAKGVIFQDLQVVPALSVRLDPLIAIVPPLSTSQEREWRVTILNNVPGPAEGTIKLQTPAGWQVRPREASFHCARKSESATVAFRVTIPGGLQKQQTRIKAVARLNNREYTSWYQVISYPHIWTRHLYHPAESRVEIFDVKVSPNLSIGYIPGPQDEIPEALKQLGVKVQLLDAEDLAFGNLRRFDCIIAGVRAYEFRDDLKAHNQRLLQYVKDGGVYIVQYNISRAWQPAQYAPYPAKMSGNERITVEESPVENLMPDHVVFNRPNKITNEDFSGWVQERGLYFWSEWDPRYRPLLSGHDPGEAPLRGGWVEAEYGKGLYIYTAYAWFRQLPAGVPGAYRLFANLISLPKTRKQSAK